MASNSHSNYPATFLSLASSLNMEGVNYLTERIGEESNERTQVYEMLQDYKVQRFLKSLGYKYIHMGSWWNPTRVNKNADVNFVHNPENFGYLNLDEFSTKLLETTILPTILSKTAGGEEIEPIYSRNNHRNMINAGFETLETIPEKFEGPKFVFAHLLTPHEPYVFNQNCNPITEEEAKKKGSLENYLNQLTCTNKRIKSVVDKILSESDGSAVIILQADEGERIKFKLNGKWQTSSKEALKEKTSILNAYYLPGVDKSSLHTSITPVNTFRLIFNKYFSADFEILEDNIYVFEDKGHPYKLFDVTEKVK